MRHFNQCAFCVAIQQQIGFGIYQNGTANLVLPIVIMRDTTQRCFDAADDDGHRWIRFAASLAVDQHAAVRALAAHTAGRVRVIAADFAVCGVAVDHRIHIAGGHAVKQIRLTQGLKCFDAVPFGLGNDANAKTLGFEHATNDRHAKTRVVHIRVASDQNDVATVPAKLRHFCATHG